MQLVRSLALRRFRGLQEVPREEGHRDGGEDVAGRGDGDDGGLQLADVRQPAAAPGEGAGAEDEGVEDQDEAEEGREEGQAPGGDAVRGAWGAAVFQEEDDAEVRVEGLVRGDEVLLGDHRQPQLRHGPLSIIKI